MIQQESILNQQNDNSKHEKIFMTTQEMCHLTGFKRSKFMKLFVQNDDFPKFKTSEETGHWRFPVEECKAYLNEWWKNQPR
jgi:predicted DNA-binding transcriptional regulator AlpA